MNRWWIIGITVVCIALLVGVYLWDGAMGLPTPPHSALEALVPQGEPAATWQARLEQAVAENPDNVGLRHLAQALSLVSGRRTGDLGEAVRVAVSGGWDRVDPLCIQALRENTDAMNAALMAISEAPFDLPGTQHPLDPGPSATEFGALVRLIALDALRLEAEGHGAEAVNRVLGAIRLSDVFCSENQPIISHLVGLVAMRDALAVLSKLLVSPDVSEESLRTAGDTLAQIDSDHVSIAEAIRAEGQERLMLFAMSIYNPALREQWWSRARNDWPQRQAVRQAIRHPDELAEFIHAIGEWTATEIDKPPWERSDTIPPFAEQSVYFDLVFMIIVDPGHLGSTQDHTMACLRLARAQCALRLGEGIEDIIDPFSGQAIKRGDGFVSSVGPDFTPGTDGTLYDPTNGIPSAGDIIAPLP